MRGEVWLAGIPGAREPRLTPNKETCRLTELLNIEIKVLNRKYYTVQSGNKCTFILLLYLKCMYG